LIKFCRVVRDVILSYTRPVSCVFYGCFSQCKWFITAMFHFEMENTTEMNITFRFSPITCRFSIISCRFSSITCRFSFLNSRFEIKILKWYDGIWTGALRHIRQPLYQCGNSVIYTCVHKQLEEANSIIFRYSFFYADVVNDIMKWLRIAMKQ
jgi:hypothetical protein